VFSTENQIYALRDHAGIGRGETFVSVFRSILTLHVQFVFGGQGVNEEGDFDINFLVSQTTPVGSFLCFFFPHFIFAESQSGSTIRELALKVRGDC